MHARRKYLHMLRLEKVVSLVVIYSYSSDSRALHKKQQTADHNISGKNRSQ